MNWMQYLMRALMAAPAVVQAVESIVTEAKSGATKKQLAMDSLGVGTAVAGVISPEHRPGFTAVSSAVGAAIDSIVAVKNAVGEFGKPAPVVEPAPGGGSVTAN